MPMEARTAGRWEMVRAAGISGGPKFASSRRAASEGETRASPGRRVSTEYVSASECEVRTSCRRPMAARTLACAECERISSGMAALVSRERDHSFARGVDETEHDLVGEGGAGVGHEPVVLGHKTRC